MLQVHRCQLVVLQTLMLMLMLLQCCRHTHGWEGILLTRRRIKTALKKKGLSSSSVIATRGKYARKDSSSPRFLLLADSNYISHRRVLARTRATEWQVLTEQ